jgi:site-specific DNA recombinase
VSKRFAFYGRLSTTDKQDPALSFPSQRKACEKKVAELGGEITREFTDQESGAHDDRPGWSALTQEACDSEGRAFDAVVIYSTSRLARDVYLASLYHRELQAVGVPIHYATGGADDSAEGKIMLVLQQAFDQYERDKLSRETRRGMREASEQGYRAGGRAPYGYRRVLHQLDDDHLGDRDKARVTLERVPEQADVVTEIFEAFTTEKLSPKAIAERLNQPGGPPPPSHVDSARNTKRRWASSTIREMLKNPVYTGKVVWNRRDFATGRQNGGGVRMRARDEWVVSEEGHLPIVSDAMFESAQERFSQKVRGEGSSQAKRTYVLSGMVKCCAGHSPRSMQGKARKGHHYYSCSYADDYGETAAIEEHAGQKSISAREDRLLRLVISFFDQRIFGPMRIERLEKQLRASAREHRKKGKLAGTRMRKQVSELDRKMKAQVQALEKGVEPELVSERIAELRGEKEALEESLSEIGAEREEAEADELTEQLARIPDLTQSLGEASPEVQRQVFEAFELEILYDKAERTIEMSATVSEAVADAFEKQKALPEEGSLVVVRDIAGAGFEPATFGL